MAAIENIFQTTQRFLDPASIQRISSELGEPSDKVQTGLRTVIPTFMSGLISKGSTPEGAEEIVQLVEEENYEGDHVIEDIFGDQYHEVASSLTPATGLSSAFIEKLMTLIAPLIIKSLGKTIKEEKMTAENLSGFLQQQRKVLKRQILSNLKAKNKVTSAIKETIQEKEQDQDIKQKRPADKKRPYGILLAVLVLIMGILAAGYFWEDHSVETMTRDISAVHTASTTKESITTGVEELAFFLRTATENDLPKRFSFRNLGFIIGSTDFSSIGDGELDFVAQSLRRFPKALIRIEAYIENTGDPEENLLLSENRAMLVREELIGRGIEPSRVRAEGRGATIGRGQVELVIQRLK